MCKMIYRFFSLKNNVSMCAHANICSHMFITYRSHTRNLESGVIWSFICLYIHSAFPMCLSARHYSHLLRYISTQDVTISIL